MGVTDECKEILKCMLNKNPEKRVNLITLIQNEYFMVEDEEIEAKVKVHEERIAAIKKEEEQKEAASKLEDKFYDSMIF